MSMRVLECNLCGELLAASGDEELVRRLSDHLSTEHQSADRDEAGLREQVEVEAYDASDS
jgi:predicted small metal-binding protein